MTKVMIIGGGFAGLAAAGRLARGGRDIEIHLIDRHEMSVFSPLLPDLISGRIRPASISAPIAPFCRRRGVRFTLANVKEILPDKRCVVTDRGEFAADFILLTQGCVTNYFGDEEMRRKSLGLKSIGEGLAIHERLGAMIDRARTDGRRGAVVVVGGGYTGFEAASHAAHLVHRRAHLPFQRIAEICPVMVVEKSETALGNVSEKVRAWAGELMRGYGIEVLTGVTAQPPDSAGDVALSNGRVAKNALVIWATGVTPGAEIGSFEPERVRGRVAVDGHLRVKGHERLFAAGDVAAPFPPGKDQPLRMGIQFSLRGGDCAARNILNAIHGRPLRIFDPWDPGYIVPLAPRRAAGIISGVEMQGMLPSFVHYFMCILRSWRWRERVRIVKDLLSRG